MKTKEKNREKKTKREKKIILKALAISMPFAEAAPADPGHGAAFILGGQNKNE